MIRRALDRYKDSFNVRLLNVNDKDIDYHFVSNQYMNEMVEHEPDKLVTVEHLRRLYTRIERGIKDESIKAFVIFDKEQPIGSALLIDYCEDLSAPNAEICFVCGFYIHPVYRNTGAACSLLANMRQWCRDNGIKRFAYAINDKEPDRQSYRLWGGREMARFFEGDID